MQINNPTPTRKRHATCAQCGGVVRFKRDGRPRQFCSDRCRDRARRDREFKAEYSTFVTGGYHGSSLPRNAENSAEKSIACRGDFADRPSPKIDPETHARIFEIEFAPDWAGGRAIVSPDGVTCFVMREGR